MDLIRSDGEFAVCTGGETWAKFSVPSLGDRAPAVDITEAGAGWKRVRLTWQVDRPIKQDELSIEFHIDIEPDLWWAPHLSPRPGTCVAQHVFRSPALIASSRGRTLVMVPDLELCARQPRRKAPIASFQFSDDVENGQLANPWFMDVSAPQKMWWLGLSLVRITRHVEYEKTAGMVLGPDTIELGFYITAYTDLEPIKNPWARAAHFLWEHYGHPLTHAGRPLTTSLDRYVEHTYRWAFNTWEEAVWQSFVLDGVTVGAPAFIVNVTQSPNYPGEPDLREFLSIWNQAWFSSLRSASGLLRYARRTGNRDLLMRANMTKELALSAPMRNGLFPSVYRTEMTTERMDGQSYRRSRGWQTGYWTNSNRCPWERGITDAWYHILDASWTGLQMLRWYDELDADPRLLTYAKDYGEGLLRLQDDFGFFPAWVHPGTLEVADVLRRSPETSLSATFLLKLAAITGDLRYHRAALRALDAVLAETVPQGRWEDFETYWSCSRFGQDKYYGRKIPRNGMYKQCNFSMFWTAEALLAAYRETKDKRYLLWGRRTLDELSMTQQVWRPPFIYVPAVGGFGVMNFDGEWNDARQSLFAELFMDYYVETGEPYLFERGIAALKAAFIMMYCPENPEVRQLWEKAWPFFGPEDYGFTMENYGHVGLATPEGHGIGSFTIYDWGNGAAAEAWNRVRDHYGDAYIDRKRGRAFGINGILIKVEKETFKLTDQTGTDRHIRVVFDDNTIRTVHLAAWNTLSIS